MVKARKIEGGVPMDWSRVQTRCNKCGKVGMVDPDFGIRLVRGIVRKQAWCKECRSGTSYYKQPRKNRTKNNPR